MSQEPGPDRSAILTALDAVQDPKSGQGLSAAGLVQAERFSVARYQERLGALYGDLVEDRARAAHASATGQGGALADAAA